MFSLFVWMVTYNCPLGANVLEGFVRDNAAFYTLKWFQTGVSIGFPDWSRSEGLSCLSACFEHKRRRVEV